MLNQMPEGGIRRIATPSGNGSHVILPKDWEGYEISLTKIETNPKKDILGLLEPYLSRIIGVYLYGSYARNEQEKDSDIDLIVITDKKIDITVKKPFDLIQIEKNKLDSFRRINPVLFYSFLFESEAIMNSSFLEDLRTKELGSFKEHFTEYLDDTTRVIKINEQLLSLDKSEKQKYVDSRLVYSLMLRLRGVYIIGTLLKKKDFSNESFLALLRNKLVHNPQVYYNLYRSVRDNKKPSNNVKTEEAEKLLELLKNLLNDISLKLTNAK